jgi:transposase
MNKVGTLAANGNGENIPTVIGIDLAKNVFAVHAVHRHGKPVLVKPQVRHDQLLELLAQSTMHRRHGSVLRCSPLGA